MIGYGEGVPDVKWIYVNGSQRNVTINHLSKQTQTQTHTHQSINQSIKMWSYIAPLLALRGPATSSLYTHGQKATS